MADSSISSYDEKTDVNGEELIEVVDLREPAAADRCKKMTINTLLSSIVTYDGEVVVYDGDIVYA